MSRYTKDAAAPNATSRKIVSALAAAPHATATELAAAAGLGRSTVTKHLALLERAGQARRTPGGQDGTRKLPDHWATVTVSAAPPVSPIATQEPDLVPAPPHAARRLRPGQLDTLVLGHLQITGASGPHAPSAIAKALGRSSGAVANCLTRLTATGRLTQVGDRPRRYALMAPQ